MLRTQTAASRVGRREWALPAGRRGTATHSATGAIAAEPSTTAGGSFTRRRTSGAATPAATRPQALARIALDTRKSRPVYVCALGTDRDARAPPQRRRRWAVRHRLRQRRLLDLLRTRDRRAVRGRAYSRHLHGRWRPV